MKSKSCYKRGDVLLEGMLWIGMGALLLVALAQILVESKEWFRRVAHEEGIEMERMEMHY
ncbi:MAG: hypothetical protein HQK50_05840 [Oligoflexia bacterium]|nr:hypothetical protein [Oligoflexia bacterium]MBF0365072.1 hypothetical protein [Oligoflexia bacterium]